MTATHETLLFAVYNLINNNRSITINALKQSLELIPGEVINLEEEIACLVGNGFVTRNDENELALTRLGENEATQINQKRIKAEFNQLVNQATNSDAFLDFCEEIYGYRMYLFNMMDRNQLNYLFNSVSISKKDTILDLGCGTGNILNNLIKKYQCQGIGVDQLSREIITRISKLIFYIEGDIDRLSAYDVQSNITFSIDSLYFSNNLAQLIAFLKSTKNNRLYLYYSQYIFDETVKDKIVLHQDHTRIAQILQRNAIPYRTIDYSINEYSLYEQALTVLPKYQKAFEDEGINDIYENKLREYRMGKELYDRGLASRHLYITE